MEGIAMRSEIRDCGIEIIQGGIIRVYFVRIPRQRGCSRTLGKLMQRTAALTEVQED